MAVAASGACSEDEEVAPTPVGPNGTIGVRIASLEATSGVSVSGDSGGDLPLACDGLVHVRVELDNWQLRPPHACGGAKQCGWLLLRIDPAGDAEAREELSAACVELDPTRRDNSCIRAVITAQADALSPLEGSHTFLVELRYGDGTPVRVGGEVVSDEVSVAVHAAAGCPAGGDAALPDAADGSDGGSAPPDSSASGDAADAGDAPTEAPSDSAADAASEVGDATDEAG